MTNSIQIKCINKRDRSDPSERITHVGGDSPERWKITQQAAIQHIESREWDFYVLKNGNRAKVVVAISRFGNKYIKTEADDEHQNNLLSLPECP